MSSEAMVTEQVADQKSGSATTWRSTLAPFVPPLVPMFLALAVCLLVFHVGLPLLGVDVYAVVTSLADVIVVAAIGVAAWFFRRAYRVSEIWRKWSPWEVTFGTRGIGVLITTLGSAAVVMAGLRSREWIGFSVAVVLVGVMCLAVATTREASEPKTVVPEGRTPDNLDEYRRIAMPWSLEPGLPEVSGEVAIWVKNATVTAFAEKNPVTKWEGNLPDFGWYVDNGDCQEVNDLADKLIAISRQQGLTTYLEVALVLDMVQKIPYAFDIDTKAVDDYWRFGLETIAEQVGDCEDSAILAVTLLSAMGHRTCFFHVPGHAAMGVAGLTDDAGVWVEAADGERYYYVETTADHWKIGELPDGYTRDQLRVAGVVAPLRARQPEPALRRVDDRWWKSESRALLWGSIGLAAVAAGIGLAVGLA